ncbi:CHAT domain-containing protein [Micromonospora sp. LOL_024]|uniref:CHAT domain-containing protein n=1 Tax=Micromonospora sp. LOL_024 TaxID=3345412 RepID=UPI003A87C5BC
MGVAEPSRSRRADLAEKSAIEAAFRARRDGAAYFKRDAAEMPASSIPLGCTNIQPSLRHLTSARRQPEGQNVDSMQYQDRDYPSRMRPASGMSVLRIHHRDAEGAGTIEVIKDGQHHGTRPFAPVFDRFDIEDTRWYHEDYRNKWEVASDAMVRRIQRASRRIGEILYSAIFTDLSIDLDTREDLRIEIVDEVPQAAVPWELMADPATGNFLALTATEFVRAVAGADGQPAVRMAAPRLLLLISRRGRFVDLDYWSVAYDLWRTLLEVPGARIEVLRPPTFDAFRERLFEAAQCGAPFAAVHFDGHGTIVDPFGSHGEGYLLFGNGEDFEYVDGRTIGRLLEESGVSLFTMNACRSADSEPGDRRLRVGPDGLRPATKGQASITEEVIKAGVPACVGMRREVFPETAARFYSAFYRQLFEGCSIGLAANKARAQMHHKPLSAGAFREHSAPVDDWSVPVVAERADTRPVFADAEGWNHAIFEFPERLNAPPLVGFGGEIMELEAAIERSPIVLIHGMLLSGKSRLAVEFARWVATTSPTQDGEVHYVELSPNTHPDSLRSKLIAITRGILVLDQADHLSPPAQEFLRDLLATRNRSLRIIVTARTKELPWLPAETPACQPVNFLLPERAEIGHRWAQALAIPFSSARYYKLLYFSGGHPGVVLLLLGAARELIESGQADDAEVVSWLGRDCDWEQLGRLSRNPGFGIPSLEEVVVSAAEQLLQVCEPHELRLIPALSRFNICCDIASVAVLMTAIRGSEVTPEEAERVARKVAACGLAKRGGAFSWGDADWFLHPLLELALSRLDAFEKQNLDATMVDVVSKKCASLMAKYRTEGFETEQTLRMHRQNIAEAMWLALNNKKDLEASHLVEAFCVYHWNAGMVDRSIRALDRALLRYVDGRTGRLRPGYEEIGLRVWEQAIRINAYWPYSHWDDFLRHATTLMPPAKNHYAKGLWLRAVNRRHEAGLAFLKELEEPSAAPSYMPGDLECLAAEYLFDAESPRTWQVARWLVQRSEQLRLRGDTLGRTWSHMAHARILLNLANLRIKVDKDEDRIRIATAAAEMQAQAVTLLRKAEYSPDPEIRAHVHNLWAYVFLSRGDLTSVLSHFEECVQIMVDLQDRSVWRVYWEFAQLLYSRGWIAKSYELASVAFHSAMDSNLFYATPIRKFLQRLEAEHPECRNEFYA